MRARFDWAVPSAKRLTAQVEDRTSRMVVHGLRRGMQRFPTTPAQQRTVPGLVTRVEIFTTFRGRVFLRGWAHHGTGAVPAVGLCRPGESPRYTVPVWMSSPDAGASAGPAGANCGFEADFRLLPGDDVRDLQLCCLTDGGWVLQPHALQAEHSRDGYGHVWDDFVAMLGEQSGGRLLELGSRGNEMYLSSLPDSWQHVGFDVLAGPNVDIVGDAHRLGDFVPAGSVDAIASIATYEHLAMPWKVTVESAKALRVGGLCFAATHQTWPVHEQPWDFWRYSAFSWPVLFNARTGFEVVAAVMGQPGRVLPEVVNQWTALMELSPGYLGTAVIARKIGEPQVDWDVAVEDFTDTVYPH